MSLFGCENGRGCTFWAVIASAVIGVITAFLQITAAITVPPVFAWVVFGIAVVYLAVAFASLGFSDRTAVCGSRCAALNTLLIGILGAILLALIVLAFGFAATSIIGAIAIGLLLFFLSLTVTSTACLVRCLFGCGV